MLTKYAVAAFSSTLYRTRTTQTPCSAAGRWPASIRPGCETRSPAQAGSPRSLRQQVRGERRACEPWTPRLLPLIGPDVDKYRVGVYPASRQERNVWCWRPPRTYIQVWLLAVFGFGVPIFIISFVLTPPQTSWLSWTLVPAAEAAFISGLLETWRLYRRRRKARRVLAAVIPGSSPGSAAGGWSTPRAWSGSSGPECPSSTASLWSGLARTPRSRPPERFPARR
jgi:hypothetical protein